MGDEIEFTLVEKGRWRTGENVIVTKHTTTKEVPFHYKDSDQNKDAGWLEWREICESNYEVTYEDSIECPICKRFYKVKSMDCHHLIPKSVAPHLIYSQWNLIFLCHKCHHTVHTYMDGNKTESVDVIEKKGSKADLYQTALELKGYIERYGPPLSLKNTVLKRSD